MSKRVGVVVTLVIVVFAALLILTNICRVREAAARAQCGNHLKQQTLGLHSYADQHPGSAGRPAWANRPAGTLPNPDLPPDRRLSWCVAVLPYIEQEAIYQRFDRTAAADDERNRGPAEMPVKTFRCPGAYERGIGGEEPYTHYFGVAGVGAEAATLPTGHPRAGVFGYDRRLDFSAAAIPDGTSNTLLLAETRRNHGRWAVGGTGTVRGLEPTDRPYVGSEERPLGGFHTTKEPWLSANTYGCCMVAMADGSVRFVTDAKAPEAWEAVAAVGGKEDRAAELDW